MIIQIKVKVLSYPYKRHIIFWWLSIQFILQLCRSDQSNYVPVLSNYDEETEDLNIATDTDLLLNFRNRLTNSMNVKAIATFLFELRIVALLCCLFNHEVCDERQITKPLSQLAVRNYWTEVSSQVKWRFSLRLSDPSATRCRGDQTPATLVAIIETTSRSGDVPNKSHYNNNAK